MLQTIHRNILDVTLRNETTRQVRVMERVVYTAVQLVNLFAVCMTLVKTFKHLLHLKYEWHIKRKTGGTLSASDRGANSVVNLLNWICFDIGPIIMDLVIAVIYFGVAFDKIFGFLVLGCIGSYFCTTLSFSQTRRKFRKEANEKNNDTSSRAVDSLLNIEQVKANVNEDYEYK